jgi:hypothetical protein
MSELEVGRPRQEVQVDVLDSETQTVLSAKPKQGINWGHLFSLKFSYRRRHINRHVTLRLISRVDSVGHQKKGRRHPDVRHTLHLNDRLS